MICPQFQGVIVPVLTPMTNSGELLLENIPSYVSELVNQGVKSIYLNGTSGEFFNMTAEERKAVAQVWMNECHGKLKVILHIGASNLRETLELVQHAIHSLSPKPDALAMIVPYFIPPLTVDALLKYVTAVLTTAPEMPFFYYHIPMCTHCPVDIAEFLNRARKLLPNLVGAKFTDTDMALFDRCLKSVPNSFQMLPGFEKIYANALQLGCQAGVLGLGNFAGSLLNRLTSNYSKSQTTEIEQFIAMDHYRLSKLISILDTYSLKDGFLPVLKQVANLCGLPAGCPRLPITAIDEETMVQLKNDLETIGFFQWRL